MQFPNANKCSNFLQLSCIWYVTILIFYNLFLFDLTGKKLTIAAASTTLGRILTFSEANNILQSIIPIYIYEEGRGEVA